MKKIFLLIILSLNLPELGFTQGIRSKDEWKDYFNKNIKSLDPIEGLWNATVTPTITDIVTGKQLGGDQTATNLFAIVRGKDGFDAFCIDNDFLWTTSFEKAANSRKCFYKEVIKGSSATVNANVKFTDVDEMKFDFYYPDDFKQALFPNSKPSMNKQIKMHVASLWIKVYPLEAEIVKFTPSSGTGFAISEEGIIATNFHVVENGKTIMIKGINGEFNTAFKAVILVSDSKNDIVLLKINDPVFTSIKNIPYILKKDLSSVGENVFVLGYPLRASMGDEIKLTNGIISSKTGFQGDITTYQITAPVQPGNSGGPLFDNKGNLIGIVNAKHLDAENVTYAIKSSYLFNLIELLDTPAKLPAGSKLSNMNLSEQVQILKDYIYIIEVN